MSGSTWGGVVGAVVGWFASGGNPYGAYWGWMIGAGVGGYIDPDQVIGPRLTDASTQTSSVGHQIPFGYGTYSTAGNIIWAASYDGKPLREVRRTESGKGGGPEQVTFSYYRSYAVGICQGPIVGLLQIKRNGKVVYDARTDNDLIPQMEEGGFTVEEAVRYLHTIRAQNSKFINKCTIYLGTETQIADALIESFEGVGEVSAFRGLAYVVIEDDDLTEMRGAIPQYEFVVSDAGTSTQTESGSPDAEFRQLLGTNPMGVATGEGITVLVTQNSEVFITTDGDSFITAPDGQTWAYRSAAIGGGTIIVSREFNNVIRSTNGGSSFSPITTTDTSAYLRTEYNQNNFIRMGFGNSAEYSSDLGITWTSSPRPSSGNARVSLVVSGIATIAFCDTGQIHRTANGGVTWTESSVVDDLLPGNDFTGAASDGTNIRAYKYSLGTLYVYSSTDNGLTFDCAAYSGMTNSYGGGPIKHAAGRWIACGQAAATPDYPIIYTSANGLPPFTEVDVIGGAGAASSNSHFIGMDADDERAIFFGQISTGSSGFVYTWDYTCPGEEIPDAPGFFVDADGDICGPPSEVIELDKVVLGSIVADLLQRVGLTEDDYDVSELTDLVDGYGPLAVEAGPDAMISPLMQYAFFDKSEHDGRLYFRKRGGPVDYALGVDDLAIRNGPAIEQTRVQEAELLRKVSVVYRDPEAGYALTTQNAERRTSTIEAKGERTRELNLVIDQDKAAQCAEKTMKVAWSETEKFLLSVPYGVGAKTVPADVVSLTDKQSNVHRVRVVEVAEDSGFVHLEAIKDIQSAYSSTALGLMPPPPRVTTPGIIGPTTIAIIDGPIMRVADDELGLYVAAKGVLSGWRGTSIQVSGTEFAQITRPANMGYTSSTLLADPTPEIPGSQTLDVVLPYAPESVTYEELLQYRNRAFIHSDDGTWQAMQYETVTPLGADTYRLSGLILGRYNTDAKLASSGATFVLFDDSVSFVQVPASSRNTTLAVKAVSFGTSADAVTAENYAFGSGVSQTEWEPHTVEATRDGSGDITVTWIGRGRLGGETAPRHSKYFIGYRLTFTDGVDSVTVDVPDTLDSLDPSYTYSAADQATDFGGMPSVLSVAVAGLNSITGKGPDSESIDV